MGGRGQLAAMLQRSKGSETLGYLQPRQDLAQKLPQIYSECKESTRSYHWALNGKPTSQPLLLQDDHQSRGKKRVDYLEIQMFEQLQ